MHSWRVWVLALAELGTAVFHGFSTQPLLCELPSKRFPLPLPRICTTMYPTV